MNNHIRPQLNINTELPSQSHTINARVRAQSSRPMNQLDDVIITESINDDNVTLENQVRSLINSIISFVSTNKWKIALATLLFSILFLCLSVFSLFNSPPAQENIQPAVIESVSPDSLDDVYKQIYIENASYRYAHDGDEGRLRTAFNEWHFEQDSCTIAKYGFDENDAFRTFVALNELGVLCNE